MATNGYTEVLNYPLVQTSGTGAGNQTPFAQYGDFLSDFIVDGLSIVVPSPASLTATLSTGTAVIQGQRTVVNSIPNATYTYPTSSDTYVSLSTAGVVTYSSVATGAAAPSAPSGADNILKVMSGPIVSPTPTLSAGTSGTLAAGTYQVALLAYDATGYGAVSASGSVTVAASGSIGILWANPLNETSMSIYVTAEGGTTLGLVESGVAGTSYTYTGSVAPGAAAPTVATSNAIQSVDNLIPVGGISAGDGSLVGYDQSALGAVQRNLLSRLQDSVSLLDFGADPKGVRDSTAALRNAVLFASITGVSIHAPAGIYSCNESPTGDANAIIGLPLLPSFNDNQQIIRIQGDSTPTCYPELTANQTPNLGTIFQTSVSSGPTGSVLPSFFGCPQNSDSGSSYRFQPITFMMENCLVRVPGNAGICAIQMQYCGNVVLQNVTCDIPEATNNQTVPTDSNNMAIYLPEALNFGRVHAKGIYIFGYYTGIVGASHARVQAFMQSCVYPYIQADGNHASSLDLMIQGCVHGLTFSGQHPPALDVLLDIEQDPYFVSEDDILVQQSGAFIPGKINYGMTPDNPIVISTPSSVTFSAEMFNKRTNNRVVFISSDYTVSYSQGRAFFELTPGQSGYTVTLQSPANHINFDALFWNNSGGVQTLSILGAGSFFGPSTSSLNTVLLQYNYIYRVTSDGYNYAITLLSGERKQLLLNEETAAGDTTVSAAQIVNRYLSIKATQTSAFTLTTDTAENILAADPNAQVNTGFTLRVFNNDQSSTGYSMTLAVGTGITLLTTLPNPAVPKGAYADYLFTFTAIGSSPTLDVVCVGLSSAGVL